MAVYTRPDKSEPKFFASSLKEQPSPLLLFQKWQAWDSFEENNFDRTQCRLDYLHNISLAVKATYEKKYPNWLQKYKNALESQKVVFCTYRTVWRLLIGWGNNPTLEAGLCLHHLYGFPFIPGSAVKGVVHHTAEMELMKQLDICLMKSPLPSEKIKVIDKILDELQLIRILFGSIHLEQNKNNDNVPIGPECPRSFLKKLQKHIAKIEDATQDHWKHVNQTIDELLDEHTGGMVHFYDAVPEKPESGNLLQPDIVNCHYGDYYSSEGGSPPSDDQSPVPVTFLAVKPDTEFVFSYRIASLPGGLPRDDEEKKRSNVLSNMAEAELHTKVKNWLEKGLGEWGIGAKTAAGYGYFDTSVIQFSIDEKNYKKPIPVKDEPHLQATKPAPYPSTIKPQSKLTGISKPYKPELWEKLSRQEYIKKIEAKKYGIKPFAFDSPARKITRKGKGLIVFYKHDRFYCEVELVLQGIENPGEAQYVWENILLKELINL